jgi:hypothetical protein
MVCGRGEKRKADGVPAKREECCGSIALLPRLAGITLEGAQKWSYYAKVLKRHRQSFDASSLPADIFENILKHLNGRDLCQMLAVSRQILRHCSSPVLWRNLPLDLSGIRRVGQWKAKWTTLCKSLHVKFASVVKVPPTISIKVVEELMHTIKDRIEVLDMSEINATRHAINYHVYDYMYQLLVHKTPLLREIRHPRRPSSGITFCGRFMSRRCHPTLAAQVLASWPRHETGVCRCGPLYQSDADALIGC